MPANFTKKQAAHLLQANGNDKFLFGDKQLQTIMTFYKKRSYATAYGSQLPVKEISEGSITYLLNAGGMKSLEKGDTIGAGKIEAEATGVKRLTVYMSPSRTISGGFTKSDIMQGLESIVPIKFAQALNTMDSEYERKFIRAVVKNGNIGANNIIDPSKITSADEAHVAKNKLVERALEMSEIVDPEFGLDGFAESRIYIDLSSALFNRLVDERLIVDAAKQVFSEGIFMAGTMGGFAVRRHEFLGKAGVVSGDHVAGTVGKGIVHAVIATDVTAAGPRQYLAANADKVDTLSEDKGYFIEQKVASVDGSEYSYAVMGVSPLLEVFGTDIN